MKNIIIYNIVFLLLLSCSKKEPVSVENEKEGLSLSYNCDPEQIIVPLITSATLNDTVIIISTKYINNTGSDCQKTMDFSIITDKVQNGTTYLNANSNINERGLYLQEGVLLINSHELDNDNYDYITITEIDNINKTISGNFAFFLIEGNFNKLHYSNQIDGNFLYYFAKIRLFAENDSLNISGSYQTDNIYINNERLEIYLNNDLALEFNIDYEIGIHNLYANDFLLIRVKNQDTNTFYWQPAGRYIVSDTLIYNHNYKKIDIEANLTEAYINGSFSNRILTIDNTEILIY